MAPGGSAPLSADDAAASPSSATAGPRAAAPFGKMSIGELGTGSEKAPRCQPAAQTVAAGSAKWLHLSRAAGLAAWRGAALAPLHFGGSQSLRTALDRLPLQRDSLFAELSVAIVSW
mmetsp:Transcript_19387/g.62113  ORF Transcript_19387/g.62113 Transcript_19387/m.62113 type:complete len:117 (+) Transcript_19387:53-403(+)